MGLTELWEPLATAEVRWVATADGGRRSGPPTVPVYAATAVFRLGGDAEVVPGWPGAAEHLSILVQRVGVSPEGADVSKIGFLAPDLARPHLRVGAELLIMEGPR